MTNYLYVDNAIGEEFYVYADNRHDADVIAQVSFKASELTVMR